MLSNQITQSSEIFLLTMHLEYREAKSAFIYTQALFFDTRKLTLVASDQIPNTQAIYTVVSLHLSNNRVILWM